MCNLPHEDSRVPRRKKGCGWKLFEVGMDRLCSPFTAFPYAPDYDDWIVWRPNLHPSSRSDNGGFCFFFDKKSMMRVVRKLGSFKIARIRYEDAFARHKEHKLLLNDKKGIEIGLCKRFKVVEFVDYDQLKLRNSNQEGA